MNTYIKIIPHKQQRYETVGDWWLDDVGDLQIRVSEMPNKTFCQLVAFHEYAEALQCIKAGITAATIDNFDMRFEDMRRQYSEIVGDDEPGDHPRAPYHHQHETATALEKALSADMGVDWEEYNKAVMNV